MANKLVPVLLPLLLWPLDALAQAAPAPPSPAVRTGALALFVGVVVMVLTQLQKADAFGAWLTRVPRPLRILFPVALSAVATVLTQWLTGSTWADAATVGLGGFASAVTIAEIHAQATGTRTGAAPAKDPPAPPA